MNDVTANARRRIASGILCRGTLAALLTFCAVVPSSAADDRPLEMTLGRNGTGRIENVIKLEGDSVSCAFIDYDATAARQFPRELHGKPTAAQWRAFRADLDRSKIWRWNADYDDPHTVDGVHWFVTIRYADRSVESRGSNRYPAVAGRPVDGAKNSAAFDKVVQAIERLVPECRI